jgi:outer membrane protein OmpA-like peptidoglycan-associated protein
LLCGLRRGAEYQVEFYICNGSAAPDSAGVYFSPDDLLYRRAGVKNVHPSLWVGPSTTSANNKNWIKFSAVYRAVGDEAFINIALFKAKPAERVSRIPTNVEFYFYVDAVSVMPLNTAERLCADAEKRRGEIYEENERHTVVEKKIYQRQRQEPVPVYLTKTIIQKIDTLVIPDVLFATNSYALTKAAVLLLDSFAASITNKPDSIIVHGHTDNQGSTALNMKLSNNRAASVATQLEQRLTGKEIIFYKRGWADEKPRTDNSTPAGRQQNRRVEIFVYKAD